MFVEAKRGSVIFWDFVQEFREVGRSRLTSPIDIILGLHANADLWRRAALVEDYVSAEFHALPDDPEILIEALGPLHSRASDEEVYEALHAGLTERIQQRFDQDVVPELFSRACSAAERRQLSAEVAPFLERIKWGQQGGVDFIPSCDLATLATWCLFQTLTRQEIAVRLCENCKLPWLGASSGNPYCLRPAPPGHISSCREVRKQAHFLRNAGSYRAEYKRLHALHQRGKLQDSDWDAWRETSSPQRWLPFAEWLTKTPNRGDS